MVAPPHVRGYSGVPLVTSAGTRLGSLCLLHCQPCSMTLADCNLQCNLAELATRYLVRPCSSLVLHFYVKAASRLKQVPPEAPNLERGVSALDAGHVQLGLRCSCGAEAGGEACAAFCCWWPQRLWCVHVCSTRQEALCRQQADMLAYSPEIQCGSPTSLLQCTPAWAAGLSSVP